MKIDLHCHSSYSKRPTIWLMKKIGCPESFTDPVRLYQILKSKGMDAVTITDHNVIDGCLEIADLPGTFISEEITAYFPEDRCKVHILAYDITERHHADFQGIRENLYDLVDYFHQEGIEHSIAHPFFQVNDRFGEEHFERLVLLFKNVELNGDQNEEANALLQKVYGRLTPEYIDYLADKHNIAPRHDRTWEKNWTGGSDDHSSLHLARTFTDIPGANTLSEFFAGINRNEARITCNPANPQMMAHNIYGTAYQYYRHKIGLDRHINKDIFLKFTDRMLETRVDDAPSTFMDRFTLMVSRRRKTTVNPEVSKSLLSVIQSEAHRAMKADPELMALMERGRNGNGADHEMTWYKFLAEVSDRVSAHVGNHMMDQAIRARVFNVFHTVGSAGSLYFMLAPYFVGYSFHSKERSFARRIARHTNREGVEKLGCKPPTVVKFTDTFREVNGVALTLRTQIATARRNRKDYTILTCYGEQHPEIGGVVNFEPTSEYDLPEYEGLKLSFPPFLQMLDYCYRNDVTHIHTATPGPMGLAALAISRILNVPLIGTYHTAFPEYAEHLTKSAFIADIMWRFMVWYYDQMDLLLVPSKATGDDLIARGIKPGKVRTYPRGVDTEKYNPSFLNETYYHTAEGKADGGGSFLELIYVGRVSKEKNLHILAEAFGEIVRTCPAARLNVVGDGPYLAEMKEIMAGLPCRFHGFIHGEELSRAYASADVFVFPSTTDTFGNVVLEAQASGIPVVVTDQGGPCENLIPGESGIIVPGNDAAALARGVAGLLENPVRLRHMGARAREYAAGRGFDAAFLKTWSMYEEFSPDARRAGASISQAPIPIPDEFIPEALRA